MSFSILIYEENSLPGLIFSLLHGRMERLTWGRAMEIDSVKFCSDFSRQSYQGINLDLTCVGQKRHFCVLWLEKLRLYIFVVLALDPPTRAFYRSS